MFLSLTSKTCTANTKERVLHLITYNKNKNVCISMDNF